MVLLVATLLPSLPAPVEARQTEEIRRDIQESQRRIEQIRSERATLQREMDALRSRVQNVSGELHNIERQLSATRSVLTELDFQIEAITNQVQFTTGDLLRSRDELRERHAVLNRRLRDIYKRGTLHTTQVLLGAESFSDLLKRYHYLRVIAGYDRVLVDNVRRLEEGLVSQSQELQQSLSEVRRLREAKLGEVAELRQVEGVHQETLDNFRAQEGRTMTRTRQLEEDEVQLSSMVAELERRRLEEEHRRVVEGVPRAADAATLSASDIGSLNWPVQGNLAYSFGVERRPSGTVLRWNGVGISAPVGTPVEAVRNGTVALAGPLEGYGPSVILSHGNGFYTLYLYLEEIGVVEGRTVESGQVVGTVGGVGTPEGPRLEFQIRAPIDGGTPQALDPLQWLRANSGQP